MNTPQDTTFWEKRPPNDEHKDWLYAGDWITGYELSTSHPHREVTVTLLKQVAPFASLLEVGCSVGPNLSVIHKAFPEAVLSGIDPNVESVERAQSFVPYAEVKVGDVRELSEKSVDVILADASLMYVTPKEITDVMNRLAWTAKKAILIIDRHNKSKLGAVTGNVWGRDYEILLKERGFRVETVKITEAIWPNSPNWARFGRYWLGIKR